MTKVKANDIDIEYDTFGNPSSQPILLIAGLGSQLVTWEVEFCQELVKKGFYVIRFDNRDVGLSKKFKELGEVNVLKAYIRIKKGKKLENIPYLLDDMADDAVGILTALKINKAHICGASMGGMIAQTIAIRHPTRVLSLISLMSTTGDARLPKPRFKIKKLLIIPMPKERDKYIKEAIRRMRILYDSAYPFNEERTKRIGLRNYDRSYYPEGMKRQAVAIVASGDRTEKLAKIRVPTLVIDGKDDLLVNVECGKATAKAIHGAKLMILNGVGHSMPPEVVPQVINAIVENTEKRSIIQS